LKLRPIPKDEKLVLLHLHTGSSEEIRSFAVSLLDTQLEPVTLELLTPSFAEKLIGTKNYTLAISFEDVSRAVQYEVEFVKKQIEATNISMTVCSDIELNRFWSDFYSRRPISISENDKETTAIVKVGVKNLDAISILKEVENLENFYSIVIEGHGGLGHGLCELSIKGETENVVSVVMKLRKFAEQLGGYAIVTHLPLSIRKHISVWGAKPKHFFLLEDIKKKVDPRFILNKGRYVGGI